MPLGTINIFLVTNRSLSSGAMAELLMTVTEAKTTVLRDLMQGSSVSRRLATGTGTDGVVIICGTEEKGRLLNGGKHFKLGELAAQAVQEAVGEALFRQTGFCAREQHSALKRLRRFGITEKTLSDRCEAQLSDRRGAFAGTLEKLNRDAFLAGAVSLYVHLEDQSQGGMLTEMEAGDWAAHLLGEIRRHYRWDGPAIEAQGLMEGLEAFLCQLILESLRE